MHWVVRESFGLVSMAVLVASMTLLAGGLAG